MAKKILCLLFVFLISFSLVACGGGNTTDTQSGGSQGEIVIPDYDANRDLELTITSWWSPVITEQSLQDYLDAGFNEIILQGFNVGTSFTSIERLEAAQLCEAKGIDFFIATENALEFMLVNSDEYDAMTHFKGLDVYDEPIIYDKTEADGSKKVGVYTLANYVQAFEDAYTDKTFYTNLRPANSTHVLGQDTYRAYVDATCNEILAKLTEGDRWISADCYLLHRSGSDRTDTSKYKLNKVWLENIGYLAEAKYITHKDLGLKMQYYIQGMAYSKKTNDRDPSYEDLSLQMYASMAFGVDALNYFCYATPPLNFEFFEHQYALVDRDGNKTPIYDAAKKINNEIAAFDHVYMQFTDGWKGVIPIYGSNNTEKVNEGYDKLKSMVPDVITSVKVAKGVKSIAANYDTLVGVMQDKDGNPGYMVVNYNETTLRNKDTVTFEFTNAQKALVYRNGVKSVMDVEDNTLTLTLNPGEGAFVIPFGA